MCVPVSCPRSIRLCTEWKFSSPWITHVRLISMPDHSAAPRFRLRKYQLIQSFRSSEDRWSYVLGTAGHFWSVGYSYVLDRSSWLSRQRGVFMCERFWVQVPIRRLALLNTFLDIPHFFQQTPGHCLKPATMYLYCCTVHFEDSLNITHQQMHQPYIMY